MSRLDQEPDVVALATELGLRGRPVEAVVRFCEERIGCWAADAGGVGTVAALEQLVADRLQLAFEDVCSDDDLGQVIGKYVAQGEYVFATLPDELDPTTFGLTIKRKYRRPASRDKYVAVIDCRGDKAARRFFTRWHEIAHLLVLEKELDAPVRRSAHDPVERLMDEIAGRIGFYEPIFGPVFAREHSKPLLELGTVEAIRRAYPRCPRVGLAQCNGAGAPRPSMRFAPEGIIRCPGRGPDSDSRWRYRVYRAFQRRPALVHPQACPLRVSASKARLGGNRQHAQQVDSGNIIGPGRVAKGTMTPRDNEAYGASRARGR